ncbi:hypothetical protein FCV25MIE_12262 [Fagus crenata]
MSDGLNFVGMVTHVAMCKDVQLCDDGTCGELQLPGHGTCGGGGHSGSSGTGGGGGEGGGGHSTSGGGGGGDATGHGFSQALHIVHAIWSLDTVVVVVLVDVVKERVECKMRKKVNSEGSISYCGGLKSLC